MQTLKPALLGAVAGIAATAIVGFAAMGWTLRGTAERMADQRAEAAIVKVLTPICVERFQQQDNFAAKLAELKDTASWNRYQLIAEAGWATIPGTDEIHSAAARACAEKLGQLS